MNANIDVDLHSNNVKTNTDYTIITYCGFQHAWHGTSWDVQFFYLILPQLYEDIAISFCACSNEDQEGNKIQVGLFKILKLLALLPYMQQAKVRKAE